MRIHETYEVAAGDYQRAGEASAAIKRVLRQLGVSGPALRRMAVAAYEAEMNLVIHSLGGTLSLTVEPPVASLESVDMGPGISDIRKAMQEGFSTAGEHARSLGFGAGMGLTNMQRNAATFSIDSGLGRGTSIRMTFDLFRAD